jgi:hypothetical protein
MTHYILSTMTDSISYAFYNDVDGLPVMRDKVTIKGGTGLPSHTSGFGEVSNDGEGKPMWTPDGVVTPISDERYDQARHHRQSQRNQKTSWHDDATRRVRAADSCHHRKTCQGENFHRKHRF